MWNKVLSFVVLCTFLISNVCYAVPAASLSVTQTMIHSTMDNMALQSFLQRGPEQTNAEHFATFLWLRTGKKFTTEQAQEILNMWVENLKQVNAMDRLAELNKYIQSVENKRADALVIENSGDIILNNKNVGTITDAGEVMLQEGVTQDLAQLLTTMGNTSMVGKYIDENGQQNDAKQAELAAKLHASGKAREMTAEDNAVISEWINSWEARVNAAHQAFIDNGSKIAQDGFAETGITAEEKANELRLIGIARSKHDKGLIRFATPVVEEGNRNAIAANEDIENPQAGQLTISEQFRNNPAVGSQLVGHEMRKEDGRAGHKQALGERAVQTRLEGQQAVQNTGKAIREVINTELSKAEEAAAAETPEGAIEMDRSLLKAEGPEAERRAMEISREACPEGTVARENLELAGPAGALKVLKTLLGKKLAELVSRFKGFTDSLVNRASKVASVAVEVVLTKAADYANQGNRIAFVANMMFKEETNQRGETMMVPRFGAAMIFNVLGKVNTAKEGIINVTMAGANADKIQDTLDTLYPDLGKKVRVYSGNEKNILDELQGDVSKLRVLYVNESDIANINGVAYIKSQLMDKVNGLKVLFTVLAPNLQTLTTQEQEALKDLQNGRFELTNVEVASDSDYQAMEQDFRKAVEVALQA